MVPEPIVMTMNDDGFPLFNDGHHHHPPSGSDYALSPHNAFDCEYPKEGRGVSNRSSLTSPNSALSLRNIVADDHKSPGINARSHLRRPVREEKYPSSQQTISSLRHSQRKSNSRRPTASPRRSVEEDDFDENGDDDVDVDDNQFTGRNKVDLGNFFDASRPDDDDIEFNDDREEEKSIYSYFQWSVTNNANRVSRDAKSVDGGAHATATSDTDGYPKSRRTISNRKDGRDKVRRKPPPSSSLMASPRPTTPGTTTATPSSTSSKKGKKQPLIDPKSEEAAKLRDLLLQELENRVNASKKKKKVKSKEMGTGRSEHSNRSTSNRPRTSSNGGNSNTKETTPRRRIKKRLSNESMDDFCAPADAGNNSPVGFPDVADASNHGASTRSAKSREDIQFFPTDPSNDSTWFQNSGKLDIHFQANEQDAADSRLPPDARSFYSKRSQSESEESYQDDDGTVLQFDPTQHDHVAKRHIDRDQDSGFSTTFNSESFLGGFGVADQPSMTPAPSSRNASPPEPAPSTPASRRVDRSAAPVFDSSFHSSFNIVPDPAVRAMPLRSPSNLFESKANESNQGGEFETDDAEAQSPVASQPAFNSNGESPATGAAYSSNAVSSSSKSNLMRKTSKFFVRRKSNDIAGKNGGGAGAGSCSVSVNGAGEGDDENGTVCSHLSTRSEMTGASAMTNGSTWRGTGSSRRPSLSVLRRRSSADNVDPDDRSAVSNQTEATEASARKSRGYGRSHHSRTSSSKRSGWKSGKNDRQRLLGQESDSE